MENELKVYFRSFTLLGQFPFTITKEGLKPSTIMKWYGIVPVGIVAIVCTMRVTLEFPTLETRQIVLRALFVSAGLSVTVAAVIMPILKSDLYCCLFRRFNRVEEYFCSLGIKRDKIKQPLRILSKHIIASGIMIATEEAFPYFKVGNMPAYGWVFYWTSTIMMAFVTTNCETYAHLLVARFDGINKELESMYQMSEIDKVKQEKKSFCANK